MTVKQMIAKIARLEGKKHQASIGDIREIVGIICTIIFTERSADLINEMNNLGMKKVQKQIIAEARAKNKAIKAKSKK
jgi:hypothetical protein